MLQLLADKFVNIWRKCAELQQRVSSLIRTLNPELFTIYLKKNTCERVYASSNSDNVDRVYVF
jgi:hypothetical protein